MQKGRTACGKKHGYTDPNDVFREFGVICLKLWQAQKTGGDERRNWLGQL